jgi:hypothetical protein
MRRLRGRPRPTVPSGVALIDVQDPEAQDKKDMTIVIFAG